ncbi:MAG: M61 family metallopeptidase [Planctomycetes bacterium]|nr:M61 family metallopeptidase [Planctomycetota bacterium]
MMDSSAMKNAIAIIAMLFALTTGKATTIHAIEPQDASKSPIQYRVSFRQAANHRVEIEVSVPTDGSASLRLMMPVWTPGSYLVREYARQIESISAYNAITNAPLKIDKLDKNHWSVETAGAQEITLRYVLYGREMGVRTNWIESDFTFLTGAATFITREDALERPHIVRLDALPQWPQIATSLPAQDSRDPWTRIASNYDTLVDSPIVLGDIDLQSTKIGSAQHHLATLGTDQLWDTRKAMKDAAKIIELEQKFWGETPYSDYWFLNLATESGGGLEHDNSCVLMTSRWAQKQRSKYIDWLALVSHEFFHAWNVRRLRPKILKTYDYNSEQYMRELWIAEGLTSYYDELFVVRAGLSTPKEYLERISKQIQSVQTTPGRNIQSLEESSFDTWIKFYRPDENAANSRISYYGKGAIVGLILDAEIRSKTSNQKSLDDCMRTLWQRHRGTGYDNQDFINIVSEITGSPMQEWFQKMLSSGDEMNFAPLLECYGLRWKPKDGDKGKDGDKKMAENEGDSGDAPAATPAIVGIELVNQSGKGMIEKVSRNGAASAAGIQAGDELVGWDGYRVTPENWSERLGLYKVGSTVNALVTRRGKLLEIRVELTAQPTESWNLVRLESPTPEQEARWKSWLQIVEIAANAK